MIEIEDLSYQIGQTPILRSISAQIPKGKITALIGPNGAGKSTLFSLIARLSGLQKGGVRIDGRALGDWPSDDLARRLAILPQRVHVSSRLTLRELVGFGRYPHSKGRMGPDCHAKRDAAIAQFGLEPLAERPIDTLSGGQQQRAYLAMVHAQDTDYLLLDEPLNNLDIAATRALMQHLSALRDTAGRTIVIVVHDINIAARYADHLIALREGALAQAGAPRDVITPDFMRSIFDTDTPVHHVDGRPVVLA